LKILTEDAPALREVLPETVVTSSQAATLCGRIATVCTRQTEKDPPVEPTPPPPVSLLYWETDPSLEPRILGWPIGTGLVVFHSEPVSDTGIIAGSLPDGCQLEKNDQGCTLLGTPTVTGLFSFEARCYDTSGHYTDRWFTITIVEE
jgi:hypothetical protein